MTRDPVLWLFDLQRFGVKLGLQNIRALLARLDHPEASFRSVLVGGTNGKGSVAAMLESVLHESKIRTGLYTSPHLVGPEERIRFSTRDIETEDLARRLESIRDTCRALSPHPSFFEVITATALASFRAREVDVAVLEVGMGGRLDATNAVPADVSVIVSVDLDHAKRLGPTPARIAAEKAGIVKERRPLVSGVRDEEAVSVIRDRCRELSAEWIDAFRVSSVEGTHGQFSIRTRDRTYDDLRLALAGAHQIENARVAVVAYEALAREAGLDVDPEAVRRGLRNVRWPGRLQWIDGDPPLLLDGAHNPAGSTALASYLASRKGPKPVLLFSAMREKDVDGILRPLASHVAAVVLTRPPVDRSAEPADLVETASGRIGEVCVEPEPDRAFERARAMARPDGFVLVAGSLYLVGTVLRSLGKGTGPGPVAM